MPHTELQPEDITAVIDTREQKPWALTPLKTQRGTLTTGDYSVVGLEAEIAVERKSLGDLLGCVGGGRMRFEQCIERLQAYPTRAVIVECSFQEFEGGGWTAGSAVRSKVSPAAAMGSVLGWIASGVPFLFCPTVDMASKAAARLLFIAARRRYRNLAGFYDSLKLSSCPTKLSLGEK